MGKPSQPGGLPQVLLPDRPFLPNMTCGPRHTRRFRTCPDYCDSCSRPFLPPTCRWGAAGSMRWRRGWQANVKGAKPLRRAPAMSAADGSMKWSRHRRSETTVRRIGACPRLRRPPRTHWPRGASARAVPSVLLTQPLSCRTACPRHRPSHRSHGRPFFVFQALLAFICSSKCCSFESGNSLRVISRRWRVTS